MSMSTCGEIGTIFHEGIDLQMISLVLDGKISDFIEYLSAKKCLSQCKKVSKSREKVTKLHEKVTK